MNALHNLFAGAATLAAVAVAGGLIPTPAHAGYICASPTQTVGKVGKNPAVGVGISMTDDRRWDIRWLLADGTIIYRWNQYDMRDQSQSNDLSWVGSLKRNPNLVMIGQFQYTAADRATYRETLFKGKQIIEQATMSCEKMQAQSTPPAPATTPPANVRTIVPAETGQIAVALNTMDGGHSFHATVGLGGHPVSMLVDSGATGMAVTQAVADALTSSGQATAAADGQVTIADGSKITVHNIVINSITLGGRTLHAVPAGVLSSNDADMLLGMEVLRRFGKFSIDTTTNQLILG